MCNLFTLKKSLFIALLAVFTAFPAAAQEGSKDAFRSTDLPLPRFVSLSSDKIHVRAGPGTQFPIKWEYIKKGLPVEITLEYDHWRKIRDIEGAEGWVHKSLLSGRRTALVNAAEPVPVYRRPNAGERLVARLEPGVVVALEACEPLWCRLSAGGYKGWIERQHLWGVFQHETF